MNRSPNSDQPGLIARLVRAFGVRFVKFGAVGVSGIFVNMAFFWLGLWFLAGSLDEVLATNLSMVFGFIVSVLTNFLLNDLWTWADRDKGGATDFIRRLASYYVVASVALLVQALVLNLLSYLFGYGEPAVYLWNLIGIGCGMLVNFVLSHYWTFRDARPQNLG